MPHTVLLVDDTSSCREAIATVLRVSGYRVVCAQDGRRAIDALENCSPDVIMLDLAMPHMSGLDLLRQIRGLPQWKDLPAILFTGSGDMAQLVQGLGVAQTLVKAQASTSQIREAVSRAVGRSAATTSSPAPAHSTR